jgi:diacylglycerol kinase family enzyme
VPAAEPTAERAQELAERLLPSRAPRRRMLVIVNPHATTVSRRLRNLVVHALRSRYVVEAVDTEQRDHATEICRAAAAEGYDVVVAFGGDGTVNEAANGLVGSDTPLTALPGGSTNVWCRTLGIPNDVVDATEHLLLIADDFRPCRVDLGSVNGRCFVFSSGVGLDAAVVERVDAHPSRKARFGALYYSYAAVATFSRRYLVGPPRMRLTAQGRSLDAVTVIVQNSDPYTYFRSRPVRVCEGAALDSGTLSLAALRDATALELPTLIPRLLSGRTAAVQRHRRIDGMSDVAEARVESLDGRPLPVHVDGDFVGEFTRIEYVALPGALAAVS